MSATELEYNAFGLRSEGKEGRRLGGGAACDHREWEVINTHARTHIDRRDYGTSRVE